MRKVTKSELGRQTAKVLAEVDTDGPVAVTDRGVARWRISTFVADPDGDAVADLWP